MTFVPHFIREETERREARDLSVYAARSVGAGDRRTQEAPDPVRTAFQRDRDRVLHSKPFRRLKHKTQVFIDPQGDHYRTRLTHTLEVAQVGRTIGRALRLNEDLIEAIALGHDVGHTPFGHAGERALDEAAGTFGMAFSHSEQSLRIVEVLTDLNLTSETKAGIGGHSKGRNDLSDADGKPTSTLEAAVVRLSDRVAYLASDADDAVRAGIIDRLPKDFDALGTTHGERVGHMVLDIVTSSLNSPRIRLSPALMECLNELKEWLFERVYLEYPRRFPEVGKAEGIVRELFRHYAEDPSRLPEGFIGVQGALDFVAGMTDRFAIEQFEALRVPKTWRS